MVGILVCDHLLFLPSSTCQCLRSPPQPFLPQDLSSVSLSTTLAFHGVESHGFMAPNHSLIYCLSTLVHESLGQSSLSVYLSDELVKHGVLGVWLQGSPTPLYMQRHGVQRAQQVCFGSAQLGTHGVLCPSALRHGQTTSSLCPQRHMPAPCVSLQGLCHLCFHTLASFSHDFQMSQGTGVLRWNSCPGLSGAFNDTISSLIKNRIGDKSQRRGGRGRRRKNR